MKKTIELLHNNYTGTLSEAGLSFYRIHVLERTQAQKMVKAAQEPAMLQWVPGDNARRFPTVEAAQDWSMQDNKIVFAVGRGATLDALAWFSQKPSPIPEIEAEYTYAIRMYQRVRGQGLGRAVMAATHAAFYQAGHSADVTWLATNTTNIPALKLYTDFGYQRVKETEDRVFMILPPSQALES